LQILDDGRLTDNHGRVVNFKNTIIIMTSNIGSDLILESDTNEKVENTIRPLLHTYFKPEFLNRIDEIIIFNKLDKNIASEIVKIQLGYLKTKLEKMKIIMSFSDKAIQKIVDEGFIKEFGARPLKRYIQTNIEDQLSLKILSGEVGENDTVYIDVQTKDNRSEFIFKVKDASHNKSLSQQA